MSEKSTPGPREVLFGWYSTAPNPRSPATGYDAGQRGWRLHAVPLNEGDKYEDMKRRPALCGLWPRHGWGGDLFIEDECARCSAAMTKRETTGEVFIDLPAKRIEERQARLNAEAQAEWEAERAALASAGKEQAMDGLIAESERLGLYGDVVPQSSPPVGYIKDGQVFFHPWVIEALGLAGGWRNG